MMSSYLQEPLQVKSARPSRKWRTSSRHRAHSPVKEQDVESACGSTKATVDSHVVGTALEQKLEGAFYKQQAFPDKADQSLQFCHTADFTDEWFNDKRRAFSAYFASKGGHATDKCGHVIRSDAWDRL